MSNQLVQQALSKMGHNGRYQKMLLLFLAFAWFEITYLLLGCPFVYMNPLFVCTFSRGEFVAEKIACRSLQECTIVNDYTITAYAGLYCEQETDRNVIQSFLYMGSVVGLFVMNVVADVKGRKFGFLVALSTATVGTLLNVIGAYSKSVWLMALSQLLCGFGGYSCMIIGYIIISDLCQDELKGYGIIAMNGFWGLAEMSYAFFYYVLPDWYNYLILIQLIPTIGILVIFSFFVPETPAYLALKAKDQQRCMKSLAHIGMFNGKGTSELEEARVLIRQAIEQAKQQERETKSESPIKFLLTNPFYIRTIFLIAIIEISTNMFYYCIQFSLSDLGFNFGIDILIAGGAETIAYFSINLFINRVQRRKGLFIVNIASFVFGVFYAFDFISKNVVVASIFLCFCRFFNTYAQGFIPLLQTQSFPEKVQSSGAGLIEGTSQLGSFVTPYIVRSLLDHRQKPIIYFAVNVLILGILPLKWVRETLVSKTNEPLLDKLEQTDHQINS